MVFTRNSSSNNITSNQESREINIATNITRIRQKGTILFTKELKELSVKVKALEDIKKLEDRL